MNAAQKSPMTSQQSSQANADELALNSIPMFESTQPFDVSLTPEERRLLLGSCHDTYKASSRISTKISRILDRFILMIG